MRGFHSKGGYSMKTNFKKISFILAFIIFVSSFSGVMTAKAACSHTWVRNGSAVYLDSKKCMAYTYKVFKCSKCNEPKEEFDSSSVNHISTITYADISPTEYYRILTCKYCGLVTMSRHTR